MKRMMKKAFAVLMAAALCVGMCVSAFAQDVGNAADNTASITIKNPAKGETYNVYKLFDATVSTSQTGGKSDSIAYTGDIPASLNEFFEKDDAGNIHLKSNEGVTAEGTVAKDSNLANALSAWAKEQGTEKATASAESDGSTLNFKGLPYGYYVITTTHKDDSSTPTEAKSFVTVTSTQPNAEIIDKNITTPDISGDGKKVDNDNVSIGETVTYTVKFTTSNYDATDDTQDPKQITSYTITDTLPDFLGEVTVTKITIGGTEYKVNDEVPQFENKEITIPWVDANSKSLYDNGAEVVITYTAKVTDKAAIDGDGNTNKVTLTWETTDGTGGGEEFTSEETIYTYAIAIKKIDPEGKPLTGAKFSVQGLQTTGSDGVYTVTGATAEGGQDTEMEVGSDGVLIIKGVKADDYTVTETAAPNGYNKLTETFTATAVKTGETFTTYKKYIAEDGTITETTTSKVVEYNNNDLAVSVTPVINQTGSTLPSTGGIGTTIFYVVGGVLVIGAGILLITKKRMGK